MQEVDFKTNRAKKYNLPFELGYRTQLMPTFARAMYYDGGEYGEVVLSKYNLVYAENIPLPHQPSSEPRAAQVVRFETKNHNLIQFVGTHFDHLEEDTDRIMQADALVQRFIEETYPTILVGDLNATPDSETIKRLSKVFTKPNIKQGTLPTYPSTGPSICIDHVLFNQPKKWKVLSYDVVCDDYITDHCVVLAILVYTPKE
jgi:endonuclease/exonuclease/phosphatase family metal-dependent hydrolase